MVASVVSAVLLPIGASVGVFGNIEVAVDSAELIVKSVVMLAISVILEPLFKESVDILV